MKKIISIILSLLVVFSFYSNQKASAASFSDVPTWHGFYGEIMFLLEKGVISNGHSFGVNEKVTREEVAVMVSKAIGLNGDQTITPFKDVPKSYQSSGYIYSAANAGIIQGYPDGNFQPKTIVNRGQMAIFLARAFQLQQESSNSFKDISPNMASYSSIKKIVHQGITLGYPDGTFKPNDTLTRGQISAFLARAMGYGKTFSTKDIVKMNDEKIVLINTDTGQGSGIVIANGLILTNHHVIEDATWATITFNNGEELEVLGIVESDSKKDIAILKTSKRFQRTGVSIRLSSNKLVKGDRVVAIGSPKGLQNTVSEGIISSFRIVDGVSIIQTNADIDYGSSGGALFDGTGHLVGITKGGFDNVNANLNFAIASEEFVPMVNKYKNKEFNSIQASFPIPYTPEPPPAPIHYPVLGNIALGMTQQEVMQYSGGDFDYTKDNKLYFRNVNVLGYFADIVYEFKGNRLVAINVYHYIVKNQKDLKILEAFFLVMFDEIRKVYGAPAELDTDWLNDEDGYNLSALWTTTEHNTLLMVRVTMDFETFGGLRIALN